MAHFEEREVKVGGQHQQHADTIRRRLAEPFAASEIKWKAQAVSGERAMAVAFIDARAVMDRLDEVLGQDGWSDTYEVLAPEKGENVKCTLRARIGGEWVTHEDVGGESEQPDDGDRCKAAFSDALKRAAVKLGVGRYLYRLPVQWVDYDPRTKRFRETPRLPSWALPQQQKAAPAPTPAPEPQKAIIPSPKEVADRVTAYEERLMERGLCEEGELLDWLVQMAGVEWWKAPQKDIEEACREFGQVRRAAVERNQGGQKAGAAEGSGARAGG